MTLWRISNHKDLSGLGGERSDGRWHTASRGKRIVYLSEHPAVALVETLANLRGDPALFPERFQLLKVLVRDGVSARALQESARNESFAETQARGDEWLAGSESALLRVPSIPAPESWNYLFNPSHGEAGGVVVEWAHSIAYDRRLISVKGS